MHPLDFFSGPDKELVAERIQRVFQQGVAEVEADFVSKDGTRTPYYFTGLATQVKGTRCVVGMGIDITDRKRAEVSLARLAGIVESSDDAIAAVDLNGVFISWNAGAERLFGYTAAEAIGRPNRILFPDELQAKEADILARVARGERIDHYETVRRRKDGTLVSVSITASPVRDMSGKIIGTSKIGRDITERKQAEEQFRILVEASPNGMLMVDGEGTILLINTQIEAQFGYKREELLGQSVELLVPGTMRTRHRQHRKEFFAHPKPRQMGMVRDLLGLRKDGSEVPLEISLNPIQTAEGLRVLASIVDITERKQLEESRLAKLSADRANQAKSEFLSRMSHELRTPLNAVLGYAQMLEMDPLSPKQVQRVQHILKGGRHLLALINEVLDITRIEAGRMTLSLEPVLVATVIGEAVDMVRPQAVARRIQLVIPVAQGEPVYVLAEQQRLKQVLLNLLSNGVKYNREGGTLTISEQIVSKNRYRLTVTDTGGGIPPALLSRLFTPFDRLEADSRTEGTGLGLVLSRNLMTAMGGTISIESEVSRGTSFTLELPLSGPPAARAAPVPSGKVEVSVPLSGKTVTVLYIEDNQSNYQLVEELVEKRPDVKLIGAMQGQLGVELAVAHRPDLILLDLNLPDIQGDEVLQRLRERPETAAIPVVMLSADALQKQVDKLLAAGARAYLTKPIEVEKFYALLDDLRIRKGG
jgi:protein-histidine pros-kinase